MKGVTVGNSQIGFVGLERMGLPMCGALVRAGYQVTAADQRAESQADAVACGAAWRDTPAQAATEAGVLITMLPGAGEVRAVMLGAAGALEGLGAGSTWIDMTSSSPSLVRPVRERAIQAGVQVLEAPVGGGIQAARDGMLQLYVGGDAGLLERHRALLEVFGDPERIVHVGGHGTGDHLVARKAGTLQAQASRGWPITAPIASGLSFVPGTGGQPCGAAAVGTGVEAIPRDCGDGVPRAGLER